MRHLKRTAKLGRTGEHRNAMLANLVCSLIKHRRVTTTLAKAKAARSVAEKMVTLGKGGTIYDRRLAAARLRQQARTLHNRQKTRIAWRKRHDVIRILFEDIAPGFKDRQGGYTRIIKQNLRRGDAAEVAILEWVEAALPADSTPKPVGQTTAVKTPEEAPAALIKPEPEASPAPAPPPSAAPNPSGETKPPSS
ncbi:MAG: 50S ribosomal protein L17 [Candidatus Omnitrophica bacterium]|nr:50S ribosomal protein L17 [Candidatus Omnitrophota bacterium]